MEWMNLATENGKKFDALLVRTDKENAPGIVLIQEIFGVNDAMQTKAKQWAALGYNVICPDLFWRQQERVQLEPRTEFEQALEFMHGMDNDHVLADLELARQTLSAQLGHDQIAAIGYCMGGRLVLQVAGQAKVKAAVSYYGVGLEQLLPTLPEVTAPSLVYVAELDSYVPVEARNQIQQNVEQRKDWTYYLYEGCDHAFARPKGEHYDPAADALATERAVEFLKKHIG